VEAMGRRTVRCWVFVLGVLLFSAACLTAQQTASDTGPGFTVPLQFDAAAIGQAGSLNGMTFNASIYINEWTSDQQVLDFVDVLKTKGQDGLVKAFGKTNDVGRLTRSGSTGSAFRYARSWPAKGGSRQIVMVTDRPFSFGETVSGARSIEYKFGIVVLHVDSKGAGTGTICGACKIQFNKKNELQIENYLQKPIRLANVRLVKQGGKG
jgi:hypothetical protein